MTARRSTSTTAQRIRHQLLVLWLPLGVLLLCYGAAQLINGAIGDQIQQGTANALGFGLHVTEPVAVDRWLFGGVLPTTWLQDRFHSSTEPRWYDAVAALIYVSHFLVIPMAAVILWFRDRSRFRVWIGAVLLMTGLGVIIYVMYPMAPPWLAAQNGAVDGVDRISGVGWQYLHLGVIDSVQSGGQVASNPVAAMPSLHAASAALFALFVWSGSTWWVRTLLTLYAVLMGLTLVYTGEHYVVDVLAGWLVAVIAISIAISVATACSRRLSTARRNSPLLVRPGPVAPTVQRVPSR